MAKVTELARMRHIQKTPNRQDTVQREVTYALMSDATIHKHLLVVYKPSQFSKDKQNRTQDYGWVVAKLGLAISGDQPTMEDAERWVKLLEQNGFQRVPVE
jgi:hypothetical protein